MQFDEGGEIKTEYNIKYGLVKVKCAHFHLYYKYMAKFRPAPVIVRTYIAVNLL